MTLSRLALIFVCLLILGEAGLTLWRKLPIPVSETPVFTLPAAAANFGEPGSLTSAVAAYGADRGTEWLTTATDGTRLTIFYFEWDQIAAGPILALAGHTPDECNVAAGFTLNAILPPRSHQVPGQAPFVFDSTHFTEPSGRSVFMFKMPWIQGLGARNIREGADRIERLRNSFLRHQGAARVLQAGIFDARDADHAWQTFQTEVLQQLEWEG